MMIRYLIAWIPMLVIAVANGALREFTYARYMTELHAHQLSTLIGSACIGVFIWFVIRTWPPSSSGKALLIGMTWGVLTVVFEFFMGLILQNLSLPQVLYDYNLLAGRVWSLFLVWLVVAPWLFFRIREARA